ncbi:MAG TPA: hypothetical protein VLA39_06740 [Marinobacterium sp.]|nr:hypothetical protein [Marinobacterium sp.]
MMFADLVDIDDLIGQLKELGMTVSTTADPETVHSNLREWLAQATAEEISQARISLTAFQAASEGLILPAAKELLETLLSDLDAD